LLETSFVVSWCCKARRRGRPCTWAAADSKCRYHRRDGPPASGT
jgi:hypothetical protein